MLYDSALYRAPYTPVALSFDKKQSEILFNILFVFPSYIKIEKRRLMIAGKSTGFMDRGCTNLWVKVAC